MIPFSAHCISDHRIPDQKVGTVMVWVRVRVRVRLGDAVVRNAMGRKVGNHSKRLSSVKLNFMHDLEILLESEKYTHLENKLQTTKHLLLISNIWFKKLFKLSLSCGCGIEVYKVLKSKVVNDL